MNHGQYVDAVFVDAIVDAIWKTANFRPPHVFEYKSVGVGVCA
jgi:hypothetical protein